MLPENDGYDNQTDIEDYGQGENHAFWVRIRKQNGEKGKFQIK